MTDDDDETFIVCVEWSTPMLLPDNVRGKCAHCGQALQYRPNIPKVPTLCMRCAAPLMKEAEHVGQLQIMVTQEAVEEAIAHRKKQQH